MDGPGLPTGLPAAVSNYFDYIRSGKDVVPEGMMDTNTLLQNFKIQREKERDVAAALIKELSGIFSEVCACQSTYVVAYWQVACNLWLVVFKKSSFFI